MFVPRSPFAPGWPGLLQDPPEETLTPLRRFSLLVRGLRRKRVEANLQDLTTRSEKKKIEVRLPSSSSLHRPACVPFEPRGADPDGSACPCAQIVALQGEAQKAAPPS